MRVSPLIGRIAALGLLAVVLLLAWQAVVDPVLGGILADRTRLAQSEALLARYRQLAAETPRLEAQLAQLTASGGERDLLAGASAVLVSAKLQSDLQQLASEAGVALRSSTTLPTREEEGFSRIGLELDLGADAETLRHLLYSIETATPALFVESLSIASTGIASPRDGALPLTIRIEVAGYMRKAEP